MPRRASRAPEDDGRLERRSSWAGLETGDPVDVLDPRERGTAWRFVAHVTNRATSATWIEVVGGRSGDERRRAFRPEQLYPKGSVRRGTPTAASFLDAPRLSLSDEPTQSERVTGIEPA